MLLSRLPNKLKANPKKVVLQFFDLNEDRKRNVIKRVGELSEQKVNELLNSVLNEFKNRHKNIKELFFNHYSKVEKYIDNADSISESRKLLLGAYFSKEYSIESAALFNPSIIESPDQSNLAEGEKRFIMSLRATGEGHISSIEFRDGILNSKNEITLTQENNFCELPIKDEDFVYDKEEIVEASKYFDEIHDDVLNILPDKFTYNEIIEIFETKAKHTTNRVLNMRSLTNLLELLESNYELDFSDQSNISERIIFPSYKGESNGMEDVRLVRFLEDDGSIKYYGTYTAFSGFSFKTKLLETKYFKKFKIISLHGQAVQDKGMALFPRKVNGKYVMISRQDGENLSIMMSDNLRYWDEYKLLQIPHEPWEFIQLGNCGSPIETEKGWLLITHAVGPMRKYVIGACLLDLENPAKIIACLQEPIISPDETEREGYVPNVVYSCGSMLNNDEVIIPYAMSDSSSGFAKVSLNDLLAQLTDGE